MKNIRSCFWQALMQMFLSAMLFKPPIIGVTYSRLQVCTPSLMYLWLSVKYSLWIYHYRYKLLINTWKMALFNIHFLLYADMGIKLFLLCVGILNAAGKLRIRYVHKFVHGFCVNYSIIWLIWNIMHCMRTLSKHHSVWDKIIKATYYLLLTTKLNITCFLFGNPSFYSRLNYKVFSL